MWYKLDLYYYTANRFLENIHLLMSTSTAPSRLPHINGRQWTTILIYEGPPTSQRVEWQSFDSQPIGRHLAIFSDNEDQQLWLQEVEAYGTGELVM